MKFDWIRKAGLTFYPNNGMKINGTPLHLRKAALEIIGTDQVEGVRIANIDSKGNVINGTEKYMKQILYVLPGDYTHLPNLQAVAGCPFHYISELG